jgi:DNA-directed RNA polymerase specialized sigma24 family protein
MEERYRAMADCLTKLGPKPRELVLKCYTCDTSIKDVAKEFGGSVTTVYGRLARVRKTLHQCIEAALRRPECAR